MIDELVISIFGQSRWALRPELACFIQPCFTESRSAVLADPPHKLDNKPKLSKYRDGLMGLWSLTATQTGQGPDLRAAVEKPGMLYLVGQHNRSTNRADVIRIQIRKPTKAARAQAGRYSSMLSWINCSACFRTSGVSRWPASMRPISRVRASPVSSCSSATVRPCTSCFSTE